MLLTDSFARELSRRLDRVEGRRGRMSVDEMARLLGEKPRERIDWGKVRNWRGKS